MTRSIQLLLTAALLATPALCLGAEKNFRGKDLSGRDLANENFDRADLSDANLQQTNLKNATLKGADLRRADLTSANLATADFTGADLRGAKLQKASLESAKFVKANLQGGEIFFAYGNEVSEEGALRVKKVLENVNISMSILKEQNGNLTFKEADLKKATMHGELDGIDFRRADLRGADLHNTRKADKAVFRGATYDTNTRWPANFDLAKSQAVQGPDFDALASASVIAANFSWTGRWLIRPETNGALEGGKLIIEKDGTYEWDYSAKATPLKGKWKTVEDGIVLEKGEGGHDWIAKRQQNDPDRPDSIRLNAAGLNRWATPLD